MLLYAGKLNFIIHITFAMSNETPPAKQADPCRPKGQLMRKRRTQGQQAAASGVSLWVVFYAFQSLFWQGLDNLSRLPADHAGKALKWLGFYRLICVVNSLLKSL